MANLLITGGAGFIGTNFVYYWLAQHPADRMVVLDALTYAGNGRNLDAAKAHAGFRFVHGNIADTPLVEQILREEGIDTIVHFAAESHVDRSIESPDAFLDTNIIGTHSLLKAARRVFVSENGGRSHRFHHVSTDEVYGSLAAHDPAFSETTPYAPNSPYSASKAASDHLVRAYHHTYGLATTVSNCSNNYGPFQYTEKLIPLMITRLLSGETLPVYGDGRNIRDWLHVEDHCRAIESILTQGQVGEVYNVGGNSECENIDLVQQLCAIVDDQVAAVRENSDAFPRSAVAHGGKSVDLIRSVKDRAGHDRRYAIDARKIAARCGFHPQVSLESGLRATVAWYLARSLAATDSSMAA